MELSRKPSGRNRPAVCRAIGRFFDRSAVELTIGIMILFSIAMTLAEFALVADSESSNRVVLLRLQQINEVITWIFVVELSLRYIAVWSPKRYFREYWIDLLATLPSLFSGLFASRLMRLFRLLRILRLFGFLSRVSSSYPYILKRGLVEYIIVCGLLLLTVLLGTSAMVLFEGNDRMSFHQAFWFNVYSLFAGEPIPESPQSPGGRVVAVLVMFMGLTIFAMFTGTISAFMVERIRTKGKTVEAEHLEKHIVICGWNAKAEIIIKEYRASHHNNDTPIVVLTQWEHDPPTIPESLHTNIFFVNDDFTRVPALERVGIHQANVCIVLNDTSGGRTEQDADARTILAALTAEKLNPNVYTCAELNNSDYASHLEVGHVNDYVVSSEYSAYIMAQAAMNRGLMGVFNELLTQQRGNQFYRVTVTHEYSGKSFEDLMIELRRNHQAILIAVSRDNHMVVNPEEHVFQENDELVVISNHAIDL